MAAGSQRSLPNVNATRLEARTVAFSADMVDSRPPTTMSTTPTPGMKFSAAMTMAVSWYSPRNSQEVIPGALTAAMHTKRINR